MGCNQALVFYHHGTLNDLLLAALDVSNQAALDRYRDHLEQADGIGDLLGALRDLYRQDRASGHIGLLAQLVAGGIVDFELGTEVAERIDPWIELTRQALIRALPGPVAHRLPVDDLAYLIVTAALGGELLASLTGDHAPTGRCSTGCPPVASSVCSAGNAEPMRTVTEARDRADVTMPTSLYRRLLGPVAGQLDARVADLHCSRGDVLAAGRLHVRRGSGLLARIAAAALRLPPSGERVPARLLIVRRSSGERWIRVFGDGPPVCSWQHPGTDGWLVERFGPLRLTFALEADAGTLHFHQRDCCLVVAGLRMPIPAHLTPRVDATVEPTSSTDQVRVRVTAPVTGPLLTCTGPISIEMAKDRP